MFWVLVQLRNNRFGFQSPFVCQGCPLALASAPPTSFPLGWIEMLWNRLRCFENGLRYFEMDWDALTWDGLRTVEMDWGVLSEWDLEGVGSRGKLVSLLPHLPHTAHFPFSITSLKLFIWGPTHHIHAVSLPHLRPHQASGAGHPPTSLEQNQSLNTCLVVVMTTRWPRGIAFRHDNKSWSNLAPSCHSDHICDSDYKIVIFLDIILFTHVESPDIRQPCFQGHK